MLFKAEFENNEEVIREELISFNSALKDKKPLIITIDDGENLARINLTDGSIYVLDSTNDGELELNLTSEQLEALKLFGFKQILFRRVQIMKGTSEIIDRQEKYFFGWSAELEGQIIYRLISLEDGVFVLHDSK